MVPTADVKAPSIVTIQKHFTTLPASATDELRIDPKNPSDWCKDLMQGLVPDVERFSRRLLLLGQKCKRQVSDREAKPDDLKRVQKFIERSLKSLIAQSRSLIGKVDSKQAASVQPILRIICHELSNNYAVSANWFSMAATYLSRHDQDGALRTFRFVDQLPQRAVPETIKALANWVIEVSQPVQSKFSITADLNSPSIELLLRTLSYCVDPRKTLLLVKQDESLDAVRVPRQLYIVLNEFVRNAKDMLHDRADGKICINIRQSDQSLVFSVDDNGPGVSLDRQAGIFRALETTKPNGSGQGLALNRWIVEDVLGGKISMGDTSLGGACFQAEIPASLFLKASVAA